MLTRKMLLEMLSRTTYRISEYTPERSSEDSSQTTLKPHHAYLVVVAQIRELNNPSYLMTASCLFQVRQHEFTAGKCSCGDWW